MNDISRVFKYLFFEKTIEELQDMIKPGAIEKLPLIVVFLILVIIRDVQTGTLDNILELL